MLRLYNLCRLDGAKRPEELVALQVEDYPESLPIIISETGVARGYGSMPYKWVSGLSIEERRHLRGGTALVVITDVRRSGGRHYGTTYRVVTYTRPNRYSRRVPTQQELTRLNAILGTSETLGWKK